MSERIVKQAGEDSADARQRIRDEARARWANDQGPTADWCQRAAEAVQRMEFARATARRR